MKKNREPLVSIIIVNWNGKNYLKDCLVSLSKISYKKTQIIVVDQNSSDGSWEFVEKKYPKVVLVKNKENTGYVGGNNQGVKKAKGKYILILNNDILVDKSFLEPLVKVLEKEPSVGVVQPKAINLRFKNKLDGGGSFFTRTGFLFHKGYLEPENKKEFNQRYVVYSVKGAYMMTRRELFNRIGGLDEDFFIYFEETDYCGRVWLSGFSVEYIPESLVYHWGGSDTKEDWDRRFPLVQYRSYKNRICSFLKNLSFTQLILVLPLHLLITQGIVLLYLVMGNFQTSVAIEKGIWWNINNLPKTLDKRRFIQSKLRKVSDREIFNKVEINQGFSYYLSSFKLLQK